MTSIPRFIAIKKPKDIIDVVSKNSRLFYIRANRSESMTNQIREIAQWQSVEIRPEIIRKLQN